MLSPCQARAIAALYKKPLPVGQLKTLIGEGDKCRVQLEEIRVGTTDRERGGLAW